MSSPAYVLDTLVISGFRAFLEPQRFDFGTKRCLAIFAPNGCGKSSLVDALEFIFSDDGTLERLGLRAINNQAGVSALVHVAAEDREIEPLVSVAFRCGTQESDGSRNARGSTRPRPTVADTIGACFIVDPLIRGYTLRQFVEDETAEARYKLVAQWLDLGPLVDVQHNLRILRQRVKAAAEERDSLGRVDAQIARQTADSIRMWDDEAVLTYANGMLAELDEALNLRLLDRTDPTFILVQDRASAEERQLGLEGLRQLRRTAAVLCEEREDPDSGGTQTCGLLPDFAVAADAQATAEQIEAEERSAAAGSVLAGLWEAAEPLFAEGREELDVCPVCSTPIAASAAGSVEAVRKHIAAHRAKLAKYAEAKKVLDDATTAVCNLRDRLVSALKALNPLLPEEASDVQAALDAYLNLAASWSKGAAPDAGGLQEYLRRLLVAVDRSIRDIEAKQGESTYRKALGKLENLVDLKREREGALRLLKELERLSTQLNAQASYVTGQIREHVQELLDTLQQPVNEIYRQIQGAGAVPIRLELPAPDDTNQHRLNLVIDFAANRTGVQPGGYLSDSQIHSLALALRLAAVKRFNVAAPLVVLDDIVTSYDADHRRAIAGMLANEFADFQVIVTTHDERFFIYLKDQLGGNSWRFVRISRLDRDFGPRFLDHKVTDTMIEARWESGNSAANEMRQAEEEWLLGICRDFGVDIRIRDVEKAYSFERSELAGALAGFLKDRHLSPPSVPGINNRFLNSLQQGVIENFGSHFQDGMYGNGSLGDERARWDEFKYFRDSFVCPSCGRRRFKRPTGLDKPVCRKDGCETQFKFADGV